MQRKHWISALLAVSLAAAPAIKAANDRKEAAKTAEFQRHLAEDQRILLALDRLTFGPRPGDVEEVRRIGLKKWMDLQLHPERIVESPILDSKLAPLDSLRMTQTQIAENYPGPGMLLALANGIAPYPADPERRAYVERLAARYKARFDQRKKAAAAGDNAEETATDEQPSRMEELQAVLSQEQIQTLRRGANEEKIALLQSLPLDKLTAVVFALPRAAGNKAGKNVNEGRVAFLNQMPTELRRRILMASAPQAVLAHDLAENKIYRAVYSNRQLQEVLADFWFNHFNVFYDKGADRFLTTSYDQDAIRPHVLGHFSDLLAATAQSPAMMFYLDNWQSADPKASERIMARRPVLQKALKGKARGLNENYARELLELHTLGVDGGYTQKDIIEVARCFTGWTIRQPQRGGEFFYNDRIHDKGEKVVLGVRIPAGGGQEDGFKVLDIVAHHPSTARFVSRKLAQRFVADEPPAALVNAMAQTFQRTDGDIRAVLATMMNSPEFFAPQTYRAKLKSPLEMVVSAVRAVNADVNNAFVLAQQIGQLGEPLYRKQEPTGYSNSSEEWVNSGTLLARMNFAQALVHNKVPGVKVDTSQFASDNPNAIARSLLFRDASPATIEAILKNVADPSDAQAAKPVTMAGLVLGSPEFQRR